MIFEVWGYLGTMLGLEAGPSLKKGRILTLPGSPIRTLLGVFSASFPLWDAPGTLKWRSLGGFRFDITFVMNFRSKMEAFGNLETLIICVRGCKNHVFGYIRFLVVFGTTLEVNLEPKIDPR